MNNIKPPEDPKSWKIITFGDVDYNVDHISAIINSRHEDKNYGLTGEYQCFLCSSWNVISDRQVQNIQCLDCHKRWTYEEFIKDSDFIIKEGEQQD